MIEAMIWPSLLLVLGLGLMVAEVFLPTGGLLGLLATACVVVSGYLVYAESRVTPARWVAFEVVMLSATWVGTIYGLPRTRLGRRVYLQPPSGDDLDEFDPRSTLGPVGSSGRALTPLRPSGMIDLGGRRVEAMAESGLIAVGATVTVVAVRLGRVVVRAD